jgi:NADH-quinone oxidoreductase subunit L
LPITFWTFLIAALAISGIPPFAGFWSKDDILSSVLAQASATGNPWYYVLWGVGLLTAGLTAFYMFRLFFAVFLGNYRGPATTAHTAHLMDEDDSNNHHHGGPVGYYDIYEAPAIMTVPLMILGLLSIIGGLVASFGIINIPKWAPLANFLAPVFAGVHAPEASLALEWTSTGLSIIAGVLGILVAWLRYRGGFAYKESRNPLYQFVLNKYYVDEALSFILIKPVLALSRFATHWLEGDALDGGSRGVAWILRGTSTGLRRLQTGYMRNYALAILLGVVLIVVYYAVRG